MSRRSGSLFQGGDSTLLLLADLVEIDSPLSRSGSPECVWPLWLCPEFVAIETDPLLDITGCGNESTLFVDVRQYCSVACSDHN